MIYEIYLNACLYTENYKTKLIELVRASNEEDKFICIYTKEQVSVVDTILNVPNIISYHSPEYFTNGNQPDYGRRLKLLILGKKKVSCYV